MEVPHLTGWPNQGVGRVNPDGTRGACIGHVCPEAASGGPIALVKDGDLISYDLEAGTLELLVPQQELAARKAAFTPPPRQEHTGWLARYIQMVAPASIGAVLRPACGKPPGDQDSPTDKKTLPWIKE